MTGRVVITEELITRALEAYRAAGGGEREHLRAALEAALATDTFAVGEEVTCRHGGITGVILAINGDEAQIAWYSRGKSQMKLSELDHLGQARKGA
jgi:hypothetical protein